MNVKITFYGWPDNDYGNTPGTNLIADQLQWQGHSRHTNSQGEPVAGGVGTYDDPISAASSPADSRLQAGTLVYIPGLKKYFLVEDDCASCTTGWLDLWMESKTGSDRDSVLQCENSWTGDFTQLKEIWVNPSAGLAVDTTPFFDTSRNQCNPLLGPKCCWQANTDLQPDKLMKKQYYFSIRKVMGLMAAEV